MNEFFNTVRSDKLIFKGSLVNFFIIIATLVFTLISYRNLPPFIPIFNQMPWGEQRIAKTMFLFIPIGISFLIFVLNLIFSSLSYKRNPLISRLIFATSLTISILTLVFIVRTILIST